MERMACMYNTFHGAVLYRYWFLRALHAVRGSVSHDALDNSRAVLGPQPRDAIDFRDYKYSQYSFGGEEGGRYAQTGILEEGENPSSARPYSRTWIFYYSDIRHWIGIRIETLVKIPLQKNIPEI